MLKEPKNRRTSESWLLSALYLVLSTTCSIPPLARSTLLAAALCLAATSPLFADPTGRPVQSSSVAGSTLPTMLFVFMLATFIGLGVITRVSRLLHTPLMSLTNAISAIAVVGAIAVAGAEHPFYINLLGAIALFASMTNIVSGFLITDRMLKMFRRI